MSNDAARWRDHHASQVDDGDERGGVFGVSGCRAILRGRNIGGAIRMTAKEKLHEQFNVDEIAKRAATPDIQWMLYGNGYKAGMEAAAAVLQATWFKTQQECAEAILKAAGKL